MATASTQLPFPSRTAAPGPHFGIVAIVSTVLFCASVVLFESVRGLHFPFPGDTAATMVTYFSTTAARVQFGAFSTTRLLPAARLVISDTVSALRR